MSSRKKHIPSRRGHSWRRIADLTFERMAGNSRNDFAVASTKNGFKEILRGAVPGVYGQRVRQIDGSAPTERDIVPVVNACQESTSG